MVPAMSLHQLADRVWSDSQDDDAPVDRQDPRGSIGLVRPQRHGRAAGCAVAATAAGRGVGAFAVQRHQPGHRASRVQRRSGTERVGAYALPQPGGCVPLSGQVRLLRHRGGRGGPRRAARAHGILPASAPGPFQCGHSQPGAGARRRSGAAGDAHRQHGDGAQRAVGQRRRAGRSHRRRGCWRSGAAGRGAGGTAAGRGRHERDVDESRRPLAQSLGARFARPQQAPGDADIVFHASATAAGLNTAINWQGSKARFSR